MINLRRGSQPPPSSVQPSAQAAPQHGFEEHRRSRAFGLFPPSITVAQQISLLASTGPATGNMDVLLRPYLESGYIESLHLNLQQVVGNGATPVQIQMSIIDTEAQRVIFSVGTNVHVNQNLTFAPIVFLTGLQKYYKAGLVFRVTLTGAAPAAGAVDVNMDCRLGHL